MEIFQYKLYKIVGKEISKRIILPLFLERINIITSTIVLIRDKPVKNNKQILIDLLKSEDLYFRSITFGTMLNEISNASYDSPTLYIILCGLFDVLENIKEELTKINEKYDYINTSWYYYTVGWIYYSSNIDIHNLKENIGLLNERYKILLDTLSLLRNRGT